MRLINLELEDVCQFEHLFAEFGPGLNGIFGNNGAGKSNTMKAILFALTGTYDNPGEKADNIRHGAPEGAKGHVKLRFEHAGVEYIVGRALATSDAELLADNRRLASGITAVNKAIIDRLGVPADVIRRHAFVGQQAISQFLSETPTVRAASYARIFGTEGITNLFNAVDKALKADPPPPPDNAGPQAESDLAAARNRVKACQREVRQVRASLPTPEAAQAAWDRNTLAAEALAARGKLVLARERLGMADADVARTRVTLDVIEADRAAARDGEAILLARAAWAAYDRDNEAWRKLKVQREAAAARLAATPAPPAPADRAYEVSELRAKVAVAESTELRLSAEIRHLSALAADGTTTCPVCGTEGVDLAAHTSKLSDGIRDAISEKVRCSREADRLEALTREEAAARAAYDRLVSEDARLGSAWGEAIKPVLPAVPRPDDGPAPGPPPTDQAHAAARKAHEVAIGRLAEAEAEVRRLSAISDADPGDVSADEATVRAYNEGSDRIAALEADIAADTRMIETLQRRLDGIRAAAAAAAPKRAWADALTRVKAAFHPTALPRVVSEQNQALMIDKINDVLATFGVDWRVDKAPELSFVATFADGRVQHDRRFSPGQRTTLALAARVAIHSLFASDLGFLALDEPTDGLSQRNMTHVATALDQLRRVAEAGALQCVVITHEPQIGSLIDHVIDLDAAP